MHHEVRGLVLKCVDMGEADRLLTVYTREMGVITLMAKGARSLKNRNFATTQQFCLADYIIRSRGDKYYLQESSIVESFFAIRDNLAGFSLGLYVLEALSFVTTAEPEGELLRLALNSLYAICQGEKELSIIKAAFEIRMLAIIGFMPDVTFCSVCGEYAQDYYFDLIGGTLRCRECSESHPDDAPESSDATPVCIITESVRQAIAYITECPQSRVFSFKLGEEDMPYLEYACEEYLKHQLERSFNSLEFYKEVKG